MSKPTVNSFACLRRICWEALRTVFSWLTKITMDFFTIPLRTTPGKCFQTVIGRNTAQRENQFPLDSWEFAVFKFTFTTGHSLQQKLKSMQQLVRCDGVLLEYCLSFIVGGTEKVVTFIKMDNSAGRSFLIRSGVGRIRHISVRVLWVQQRVKEKGLIPSCVRSRENPADLGTKRLAKARMAKFNRTT